MIIMVLEIGIIMILQIGIIMILEIGIIVANWPSPAKRMMTMFVLAERTLVAISIIIISFQIVPLKPELPFTRLFRGSIFVQLSHE